MDQKTVQEKETKANPLGQWLETGGPGREKGVPNKYSEFKAELFSILKDNKEAFRSGIEKIINKGTNTERLQLLRIYVDMCPKELRAAVSGGQVILNLNLPAGMQPQVEKPNKGVIDVRQDQ